MTGRGAGRTERTGLPRALRRPSAAAIGLLSATGRPILVGAVLLPLLVGGARAQDVERGAAVYDRWCAECHGAEGRGDGPAANHMLPRPRDLTAARYQIRTTGSGELPTDEDLRRVLRDGLPGTTMPGWPNLSGGEHEDLVAYLKSLSPFFEGPAPEPMEFGEDPGGGEEALASGRAAYETMECDRCHGEAGRGDGSSAPTLEDWRELPIRAVDLTEPWLFNGGSSVEDIHARILTGLDGTPMPAAVDALASGIVSADELWHLSHYVRSLAPERIPPRLREVVRIDRAEDGLPDAPDDEAWDEVEAFYFPLAGQVIETPRQFAPTVDGLWVQGLHDGTELALRLTWHDPSRSPDPAWDEWQAKIAAALYADGAEVPTGPLPDALAVQLPPEVPEGNERPYFLMGTPQRPVHLLRWNSTDGVSAARATGLARIEPTGDGSLTGSAAFEAGRWRLLLRRPLAAAEGAEGGLAIPVGTAFPVAFHAWDGSSGETGTRGSISTWYYVFLEEQESRTVYMVPLLAVVLTGGLGFLAVRRAQSRWRA